MSDREDILLEFGRNAMACRFEVLLHPGQPEIGPEAAMQALDVITQLEQSLSVYIPTSDLSRANARASETPVEIGLATIELLQLGQAVHAATEGCFDMTAQKLSQIWGFFRRQGKMPTNEEIDSALQCIGSEHIELNEQERTIRFLKPIEINPGGIGKGYAIDSAAGILEDHGVLNYAIHGGKSSIRCRGSQLLRADHNGWRIAVRHPEQTERILGTLVLNNKSLGTSGPANQFFYFQGKRYGHIIDPRTGWPADGMLSVTVLHPSAGWADALATGLYVMGLDRAIAYCEQNPDVSMLAILPGNRSGETEIVTCNLNESNWIRSSI